MRIAVFSGSFDPLHKGHLAIMDYLSKSKDFDWVYMIVSPQNPFKHPELALTGHKRYLSAIQSIRKYPQLHVWVDDIEMTMPSPHYTIHTLDTLRQREPGNVFTLIIGADNLASIEKWKESERLLLEYGVSVYPREGYNLEDLKNSLLNKNPNYKITTFDAPKITISSTQIRSMESNGEDVSNLVI